MKYLKHSKDHSVMKSKRWRPLLARLEVIAEIGDMAMKAAPESVGLVWTGFKFVFDVSVSSNQHDPF